MEIIKRNSSLTEYNNCIGEDEINDVLIKNNVYDGLWSCIEVGGGIIVLINEDNTKSLVSFAPREKDNTVDIVSIELSKYVTNISRAVAQFLGDYNIPNPFGLKNKRVMKLDRFLDNLSSYMSIAGNTDEEIEESLAGQKLASENEWEVKAIVGDFGFEHFKGKVRINGGAVRSYF